MNAYVAVTNPDWFRFLAKQDDVDEVNFWYPNPWGGKFGVLSDGQPLLFKLSRPHNHIAGGGFFKHYTNIPLSRAWETFGEKNGASTYVEFRQRIFGLRREKDEPWKDPDIGCVLLVEPFFWPEELWIPDPPGFKKNTQRGKKYDLTKGAGKTIWDLVVERLEATSSASGFGKERDAGSEIPGGYADALSQRRLGQGVFRSIITDIYDRRCAVTSEKALPALEAAHIQPFSERQAHEIRNGILLRSDVHKLFDAGYVTITPGYRAEVSRRIREDFDDGETYLKLHGEPVGVPEAEEKRPDPEALTWHNENRFRG